MPTILGRTFTRRELERHMGDLSQVMGVELSTFADGPERGVRVLRFRSGSGLEFDILPDRGMDLAAMTFRGVPIGWRSPTGFRSPWLHEAESEDGLGWLRSFSGMLNTSGLDHIMAPAEEDADHYRYPHRSRIRHGLHGRAAYIPARLKGYGLRWENDRCWLYAEGEVRQAAMFAENLLLERRVEVEVGTDTLTMTDKVTSLGFHPTPHALLYHINIGWPVVDAGTRLTAPIRSTPFTTHDAAKVEVGPIEQTAPRSNFVEQVYEHEVAKEADGTVPAGLINRGFAWPDGGKGLGVALAFDGHAMPALFQWQNLQEGNYVIGIEPATLHAGSRADHKARGTLPHLGHGESRSYRLAITPLAGEAALDGFERRVAAIG